MLKPLWCFSSSLLLSISDRSGRRSSALHGCHALGRHPRCSVCAPAAGGGCHMLLCQQMRPHHVSLRQVWHWDQRTQLGGGEGGFHVSLWVRQNLPYIHTHTHCSPENFFRSDHILNLWLFFPTLKNNIRISTKKEVQGVMTSISMCHLVISQIILLITFKTEALFPQQWSQFITHSSKAPRSWRYSVPWSSARTG